MRLAGPHPVNGRVNIWCFSIVSLTTPSQLSSLIGEFLLGSVPSLHQHYRQEWGMADRGWIVTQNPLYGYCMSFVFTSKDVSFLSFSASLILSFPCCFVQCSELVCELRYKVTIQCFSISFSYSLTITVILCCHSTLFTSFWSHTCFLSGLSAHRKVLSVPTRLPSFSLWHSHPFRI